MVLSMIRTEPVMSDLPRGGGYRGCPMPSRVRRKWTVGRQESMPRGRAQAWAGPLARGMQPPPREMRAPCTATMWAATLLLAAVGLGLPADTWAGSRLDGQDQAAQSGVTAGVESAAALDLEALETRLRETRAIGLFTKLSLRNQVDDLLEEFRRFHQGQGSGPLARLYERFDLLLMKVLSLLQDDDPALARDIVVSRDALWQMLADPQTFANSPT